MSIKKESFDSEKGFDDCEFEEVETKDQTHLVDREEDEDNINEFPNIDLIRAISETLETILEGNKYQSNYKEKVKNQEKMAFSSKTIPKISLKDYLIRIQNYANMEKNTLIMSLIYIDRLCKIANLTLTYYNIHRILFTAVLLSIKFNEDCFFENKFYAQIAGIKEKELKSLEYNFSIMINFRFFVVKEIFEQYRTYLDNFEQ
jgi:hypothetical protein